MQQVKKNNQERDISIPNPPSDGVACMAVNGNMTTNTTMLLAGSWDNHLYMYELQYQAGNISNIVKHHQLPHEAPVLCADVASDGMTTFSAGCDGQVRMWNASQPVTSVQVIGKHDAPIRCMRFLPEANLLVTGSWDKSVRLWDCRSPNPAAVLQLSERVYAMDAKQQAIVVGTADKMVSVFQLQTKVAEFKSSLNYQTRCISIFHDNQGFAMGSIEGRISLEYYNEMNQKMANQRAGSVTKSPTTKSFVFKCHREGSDVFCVNSIDFCHKNTFCSAGSDGVMAVWDKEARNRLSLFEAQKARCPVSCVKFSPLGNLLFYAVSYDWSRGHEYNNTALGNNIGLHYVQEAEITPKAPGTTAPRR
jgi:mRNA export factor